MSFFGFLVLLAITAACFGTFETAVQQHATRPTPARFATDLDWIVPGIASLVLAAFLAWSILSIA